MDVIHQYFPMGRAKKSIELNRNAVLCRLFFIFLRKITLNMPTVIKGLGSAHPFR